MTQTGLDFTKKPTPRDLNLTPDTQLYRLYARLLEGPTTNAEIVRGMGIFNSTGRISDLREILKPHLLDIGAIRLERGKWEYRLCG